MFPPLMGPVGSVPYPQNGRILKLRNSAHKIKPYLFEAHVTRCFRLGIHILSSSFKAAQPKIMQAFLVSSVPAKVFRHLPTGDVITEMSHTRKNKKLCILYFS